MKLNIAQSCTLIVHQRDSFLGLNGFIRLILWVFLLNRFMNVFMMTLTERACTIFLNQLATMEGCFSSWYHISVSMDSFSEWLRKKGFSNSLLLNF